MTIDSISNIAELMGEAENAGNFKEYPIADIQPDPNQPRKTFDEDSLNDMAVTMKEYGVLQPIVIRPVDDGYMIVAGERRWRAAGIAELEKIPAIVREVEPETLTALQLIENLQRDDMPPLEEAEAIEAMMNDFGMTGSAVARAIGKKPAYVSLRKKLLSLPEEVRDLAVNGTTKDAETLGMLGDLWELDPERADYYIANPDEINRATLRQEVKRAKSEDAPQQPQEPKVTVSQPSGGLDSLPNEDSDYDDLGGSQSSNEGDSFPLETQEQGEEEGPDIDQEEQEATGGSSVLSNNITVDEIGFMVELVDLASNEAVRGYLITDKETPCGQIWIETEDGEQGLYDCNNDNVCIKGAFKK